MRDGRLFGWRNKSGLPDRSEAFLDIFHLFAGVILPLVVLAAFLETFVTPLIYKIFA